MLSDHDLDDRLRAYFTAQADDLPHINLATPDQTPTRARWAQPWRTLVPAAAAAAVVGGLLIVPSVVSGSPDETDPAATTPAPSATPAIGVSAGPNEVTVYAYRLVNDGTEGRVIPTQVPVEGGAPRTVEGRIAQAVGVLLDHEPTGDADSVWDRKGPCPRADGVRVTDVAVADDLITIDFTASDDSLLSQCLLYIPVQEMADQQMAWTVATASGSRAPVKLTINGLNTPGSISADPAALETPAQQDEGYPVNDQGQSYGAIRGSADPSQSTSEDSYPDLISVVGQNGRKGYVLKAAFVDGPPPASPAEAVLPRPGRLLDVYLSDGTTVIGTFGIAGSDSDAGTPGLDDQVDYLVAVVGDAGGAGFVYKRDLDAVTDGDVATPAEAIAREKKIREGTVDLTIPVYQADGTTKIDTFTLDPGTVSQD